MKKLISLLLSITMLLSITAGLNLTAFAATSGECGDNVTWSFNSKTGELTLSGYGNTYDYENFSSDTPFCKENNKKIKSVVVEDGITGIGSSLFYCCTATKISLPESLTYIGYNGIRECENLTEINFPSSLKTVDDYGLCWLSSLTVIDLSQTQLKEIGWGVLWAEENLQTLYLPSSITKIEGDGLGSAALTDIYFGGTKQQWNAVKISDEYDYPTYALPTLLKNGSVTVHCTDDKNEETEDPQPEDPEEEEVDTPAPSDLRGWQYIYPNVEFEEAGKKAWMYFDNDGYAVLGWKKIGKKWYYFNEDYGYMLTNWQKVGKKWYYFKKSGAMVTGWQKISKKWYYFKKSGAMVTGWKKIGKKWYYFKKSGAMVTGWLKSGGKWYYFNKSGAMLANTRQKIGKKTYRFNKSGACLNP